MQLLRPAAWLRWHARCITPCRRCEGIAKNHPRTEESGPRRAAVRAGRCLHNLGGLEHARGRFQKGEPYARMSVAIRARALGPGHPAVAADQAALAAILEELDQLDEAEQLYEHAIAIFERTHGPVHYELCINFNNLAALKHKRGQTDQAEQLYLRALALKEQLLGLQHPDVAMTLNNLAALYAEIDRPAEAVAL